MSFFNKANVIHSMASLFSLEWEHRDTIENSVQLLQTYRRHNVVAPKKHSNFSTFTLF